MPLQSLEAAPNTEVAAAQATADAKASQANFVALEQASMAATQLATKVAANACKDTKTCETTAAAFDQANVAALELTAEAAAKAFDDAPGLPKLKLRLWKS